MQLVKGNNLNHGFSDRVEALCKGFLLTKDSFPDKANVFCKGFLMLYCQRLGLDENGRIIVNGNCA